MRGYVRKREGRGGRAKKGEWRERGRVREMSMQERECAREKGERVCESERVE